jgi:UDP-GlcNAc3NAcA epimerase
MKITTVIGARPQFIKAAALSAFFVQNFASQIEEKIIHTGQHFDANMSEIFFSELQIPRPYKILSSPHGTHGAATGQMMAELDEVLISDKPDLVLVYGDTNSTIAAALSASKLQIPVAHVEAGMRSWNRAMPEELNRVVTDHLSEINFAPSEVAMSNLDREGLSKTSHLVGDIMYDALLTFAPHAKIPNHLEDLLGVTIKSQEYGVATFHRQENTDNTERLTGIIGGLNRASDRHPVVLPMHPRLKLTLEKNGLISKLSKEVKVLNPVSYLEMLALLQNANFLMTDSGGLQKEAFFLRIPCVTVRQETEWLETVELGWNRLTEPDEDSIADSVRAAIESTGNEGKPYGEGQTAGRISEILLQTRNLT